MFFPNKKVECFVWKTGKPIATVLLIKTSISDLINTLCFCLFFSPVCLTNIGYKCGRSKSIDCNFRYEDTSGLRFRRSRQIIRQIVQNNGFGKRCPHHTVNFWPTPDHNLKFKIWLKSAKLAFAVHNGHNGKVIMDFYLFFYSFLFQISCFNFFFFLDEKFLWMSATFADYFDNDCTFLMISQNYALTYFILHYFLFLGD